MVFVTAAAGADLAALRTDLTDAAKPYLVVSVMDNAQFADALSSQVNQVLVILYALLGLSIVIAVLGIVNTLALSIAERTREIGLLRAVGLGRLQLASVVTVESVMTAVFGTVLGVAIGTGIASALPSVFADQGLSELVVPWGAGGALRRARRGGRRAGGGLACDQGSPARRAAGRLLRVSRAAGFLASPFRPIR